MDNTHTATLPEISAIVAEAITDPRVKLWCSGGLIRLSVDIGQETDSREARQAVQRALSLVADALEGATGRKTYRAQSRGCKVWGCFEGHGSAHLRGWAVGIRVELTEAEQRARRLGMGAGWQ